MCSGRASDIGSRTPRSRPSIRPLPVDSPTSACHRNPEKRFQGRSPRIVIEHSCPLVETSRVPRVREAKLSEVEMMPELVAKGAQECAERSDFLSNRRPHPHPDQHGVGGVVAKEFERPTLAGA